MNILDLETLKVIVRQPLTLTETADKFDVISKRKRWRIHRTGWSNPSWYCKSIYLTVDADYRPVLKSNGRFLNKRPTYEGT